jgi:hypothetical protein
LRTIGAVAIGVVIGVVLMLSTTAIAQSLQVKHFACHSNTPQTWESWYYLPNGADSCPPNYTKIDWVDD